MGFCLSDNLKFEICMTHNQDWSAATSFILIRNNREGTSVHRMLFH